MRTILRAVLIVLVFVAVGFLVLGYWTGAQIHSGRVPPLKPEVGTSGEVDVNRARERGAELGERAAVATKKVGEAVNEASLTTKIKAKMALDDSVKARAIDVTTDNGVVTLSGTVRSTAERDRAVALARETDGVTRVIDQLKIGS